MFTDTKKQTNTNYHGYNSFCKHWKGNFPLQTNPKISSIIRKLAFMLKLIK